MLTRTMMLALAVGSLAAGCVTEEQAQEEMTGTAEGATSGGWDCDKAINVLSCNHAVLPITVVVEDNDVNFLNDNDVLTIEDSLNKLYIPILSLFNISNVLTNIEATVLKDLVDVGDFTVGDIDVCANLAVLGGLGLLCK